MREGKTMELFRKYGLLAVKILLTLAFVAAGGAKLLGAEMMVATFDTIGFGQWFRYVTGGIEVGAALLLWVPRRQLLASVLLAATMIGAGLAHLLVLGPSAVPATVLLVLSLLVAWAHRDQRLSLAAA